MHNFLASESEGGKTAAGVLVPLVFLIALAVVGGVLAFVYRQFLILKMESFQIWANTKYQAFRVWVRSRYQTDAADPE